MPGSRFSWSPLGCKFVHVKKCIKAVFLFSVGWKNVSKGCKCTKIIHNNFTVYKFFWGEAQYFLSPSKSP